MTRDGKGIEQLGAAAAAHAVGGGRHAFALLAEDDALVRRCHLPQRGEVAVSPAVTEEVPHGRLVLIAGEERVGIGRRTPERDQIAVRPIKEAKTSDESGCHRQPLEELGRPKPELGGPLPIDKSPLQDKHRTRRLGSEMSVGPLLCSE